MVSQAFSNGGAPIFSSVSGSLSWGGFVLRRSLMVERLSSAQVLGSALSGSQPLSLTWDVTGRGPGNDKAGSKQQAASKTAPLRPQEEKGPAMQPHQTGRGARHQQLLSVGPATERPGASPPLTQPNTNPHDRATAKPRDGTLLRHPNNRSSQGTHLSHH